MSEPKKDFYHLMALEKQNGISIFYYGRFRELKIKFTRDGFKLDSDSKSVSVQLNAEDNIKMIQFMDDNNIKPF